MSEQSITVGQVWERKSDGVRVVIERYWPEQDDCSYTKRSDSPRRPYRIYGCYLRQRYRLISEPT